MEELKSEKTMLLSSLDCNEDTGIDEVKKLYVLSSAEHLKVQETPSLLDWVYQPLLRSPNYLPCNRATDINDLLTNVIGTMLGYLCFRLTTKLELVKLYSDQYPKEKNDSSLLPVVITIIAFVLGFFS